MTRKGAACWVAFNNCLSSSLEGFPGGASGKELPVWVDVRDAGLIPWSGRAPGGGYSHPLQYSCLENRMDRGTWWTIVHRVAQSQTWRKWLSTHACKVTGNCGCILTSCIITFLSCRFSFHPVYFLLLNWLTVGIAAFDFGKCIKRDNRNFLERRKQDSYWDHSSHKYTLPGTILFSLRSQLWWYFPWAILSKCPVMCFYVYLVCWIM